MPILPTTVFKGEFPIRTTDIDRKKQILAPSLLGLMQEAAMQNAIQMGISIWDMNDIKLSWVIMKMDLDIFRLPKLGERIHIKTHGSGFQRIFTFRDYYVYDQSNQVIAQASSTWVLMNTETRQADRTPESILSIDLPEEHLPRPNFRIPRFQTPSSKTHFKIGFHDLDFNGHLNNVLYLKWMLECLPKSFLEKATLKKLQIQYKLEAYYGDSIRSEFQQIEANQYLVRIIRESDEKELAIALTYWNQ